MSDLPGEDEFFVDYHNIRKAALVLRAMNNDRRRLIMELLNNNKQITVTDIYRKLRMQQAIASQHLAILRRAGIVLTKRDGKCIYYHINYRKLNQVNIFVNDLLGI